MNRISLRVYLLLSRDNALDSTDPFGKWSRLFGTNLPRSTHNVETEVEYAMFLSVFCLQALRQQPC
jgi:hypothetical protein